MGEQREAFDAWEDHISKLVHPEGRRRTAGLIHAEGEVYGEGQGHAGRVAVALFDSRDRARVTAIAAAEAAGGQEGIFARERFGNDLMAWALIERKRDGTNLSVASAARLVLRDAPKVLSRNGRSWLEKAHREVERWGQGGTDADVANFRKVMLAAARGCEAARERESLG